MKRLFYAAMALPVFAILWAAMHDILQGEPDPWMEVAAAVICLPALAILVLKAVRPARAEALR